MWTQGSGKLQNTRSRNKLLSTTPFGRDAISTPSTSVCFQSHKRVTEEGRADAARFGNVLRVPVPGGYVVCRHRSGNPSTHRPVLFLPGWGADWEYFADLFDEVDHDVPLYFLESREKRSSEIAPGASYSMPRFARDVALAVHALGLGATDYVLVGTCFGSGVLLETLRRKLVTPTISVLFDPMPRLWVPRWILHWIVPLLPIRLVALLRPTVRRALLYGMTEEAQRARTRKIIDSAVLPKWKPGSFQIRDWSAYEAAPRVTDEVHVLNAASDRFHDGSVYPFIASLMPNGTYIRFFIEGRDRERFMGTVVNAYSRSRGKTIPPELAAIALIVKPTNEGSEVGS